MECWLGWVEAEAEVEVVPYQYMPSIIPMQKKINGHLESMNVLAEKKGW